MQDWPTEGLAAAFVDRLVTIGNSTRQELDRLSSTTHPQSAITDNVCLYFSAFFFLLSIGHNTFCSKDIGIFLTVSGSSTECYHGLQPLHCDEDRVLLEFSLW